MSAVPYGDCLIQSPGEVPVVGQVVHHITKGSGGLKYDALSTFVPPWAEEHRPVRITRIGGDVIEFVAEAP